MLESKNISSQSQGQVSEDRAALYYKAQSYRIVARNKKISNIEVDLILFQDHWVFVEVKTLRRDDEVSYRLKKTQIKRLLKAKSIYENRTQHPVELRVLYVLPTGTIELPIEAHF